MRVVMDKVLKYRKWIFCITAFLLIINSLQIPMRTIGGVMSDKLSVYPLFIGIFLEFYCLFKYRKQTITDSKAARYAVYFLGVYILVSLISMIHGAAIFPYLEYLFNDPGVIESGHMDKAFHLVQGLGIHLTSQEFARVWLVVKGVKPLIKTTIFTFGVAFMIYNWARKHENEYFSLLTRATVLSICLLTAYSVIEWFYLAHYSWATHVLSFINPWIHGVQNNGGWWPPLLWKGQLRSMFPEPSHFGIYASFAMPLLWYSFVKFENKRVKYCLGALIAVFTFDLFLTNARTAMALFLGEIILLIIFTAFIRDRRLIRHVAVIVLVSLLAFGGSVGFINHFMPIQMPQTKTVQQANKNKPSLGKNNVKKQAPTDRPKKAQGKTNSKGKQVAKPKTDTNNFGQATQNYIDYNFKSLADEKSRSNRSRFGVMRADFEVGLDHPAFGVSPILRQPYVLEKIAHLKYKNNEMKSWLRRGKEIGAFSSGVPELGAYTTQFSKTGAIGLFTFLLLPVFLVWKLLCLFIKNRNNLSIVFFLISFIGIMASGIGDHLYITYCYWILLGIGYAMAFGLMDSKESSSNEEK